MRLIEPSRQVNGLGVLKLEDSICIRNPDPERDQFTRLVEAVICDTAGG